MPGGKARVLEVGVDEDELAADVPLRRQMGGYSAVSSVGAMMMASGRPAATALTIGTCSAGSNWPAPWTSRVTLSFAASVLAPHSMAL